MSIMPENPDYGIIPSYKPEQYVWLRKRLELDLLSIDEEIQEMPQLIQSAGEITGVAIEARELAKEDLEKTKAKAAEDLRSTPKPNGKDRTETAITTEIFLSHTVSAKQEEYSTARLDAALWSALVESLRRKDSAIRVVADLLNSGFLTSSSIRDRRRSEIRHAKAPSS